MRTGKILFWEWLVRSTFAALLFSYSVSALIFEAKYIFIPISLFVGLVTIFHYFYDLKRQKVVDNANQMKNGAWVGTFVSISSVLFFLIFVIYTNF